MNTYKVHRRQLSLNEYHHVMTASEQILGYMWVIQPGTFGCSYEKGFPPVVALAMANKPQSVDPVCFRTSTNLTLHRNWICNSL